MSIPESSIRRPPRSKSTTRTMRDCIRARRLGLLGDSDIERRCPSTSDTCSPTVAPASIGAAFAGRATSSFKYANQLTRPGVPERVGTEAARVTRNAADRDGVSIRRKAERPLIRIEPDQLSPGINIPERSERPPRPVTRPRPFGQDAPTVGTDQGARD